MNVAIVGAGLVGRLLTWRLMRRGVHVTLCDQHEASHIGTGLVAAAMIAPYTEAVTTEPKVAELGKQSWDLWHQWLIELKHDTQQDIAFNTLGTLVIAHTQDEADWQRFLNKAQTHLPNKPYQLKSAHELRQIEPELSTHFNKALYFANEGNLNNDQLYRALETHFQQSHRVDWHQSCQIDILNDPKVIKQGFIRELNRQFDWVIDCRGNGAKKELDQFRSIRGEVIRVYAPEVSLQHNIRLIHPRYPIYIAPRENHQYIIGATQIESDADHPVTIRSALELLSALYSLHTGFSEAQIQSMRVGLRPTFNDNLPKVSIDQRLIRFNGLYRHGYLFSPTLIDQLLQDIA